MYCSITQLCVTSAIILVFGCIYNSLTRSQKGVIVCIRWTLECTNLNNITTMFVFVEQTAIHYSVYSINYSALPLFIDRPDFTSIIQYL